MSGEVYGDVKEEAREREGRLQERVDEYTGAYDEAEFKSFRPDIIILRLKTIIYTFKNTANTRAILERRLKNSKPATLYDISSTTSLKVIKST